MAMVSLCAEQRWLEIQRRCWVRAETRRRKCTFLQFTYGHSNKSKCLLCTTLFQGCIAHIFSIIQNINANSSLCCLPAFSQGPFLVWMGKLKIGAHVHIQCFCSTCEAAEHKEICMYNICKFVFTFFWSKRTQKGRQRLNHVTLPLSELPATCKQHT